MACVALFKVLLSPLRYSSPLLYTLLPLSSTVLPYVPLSLYRTKWVRVDGAEYKPGAGVVLAVEHDLPQIGQITTIYVLDGATVLFRIVPFSSSYLPHFRGYSLHELPLPNNKELFYMSDLVINTPIHIRRPQSLPHHDVVLLPYHLHCTT